MKSVMSKVAVTALAVVAFTLVACDKNESEVKAKCSESFSSEVCSCVVDTLNEHDAIEDVAENLRQGGARAMAASTMIEGTALACRI